MAINFTKLLSGISMIVSSYTFAQVTESFDTFTLTPNSFYQDNNGTDWKSSITSPITFEYGWSNNQWSSGSIYTNIHDTLNLTTSNLFGCAPYNAYDGTNYAVVKDSAIIVLKNTPVFFNKVSGFFITNTAFTKNIIKNGSGSTRKFGDTTGTGWGAFATQGTYPDWFRLKVYGYKDGFLSPNVIQFYLADYRSNVAANDFIVSNWRYVNCIQLGIVDSLKLILESSDVTANGKMKTPGYFCIDRFTTTNDVGIRELQSVANINLYPNPTNQNITLKFASIKETELQISILDISGKEVLKNSIKNNIGNNSTNLETQNLEAGIYFIKLSDENSSTQLKFIKF